MSTTKNWRESFREQFVKGHPGDSGIGGNTPTEPESWVEAYPEEMESFISNLLSAQREEIVGFIDDLDEDSIESVKDAKKILKYDLNTLTTKGKDAE